MRIKPVCLTVSKGTGLHTLSHPQTVLLRGGLPLKGCQGQSLAWAGQVQLTSLKVELQPHEDSHPCFPFSRPHGLTLTKMDHFGTSKAGWCAFPKANVVVLPFRRLHEQRPENYFLESVWTVSKFRTSSALSNIQR